MHSLRRLVWFAFMVFSLLLIIIVVLGFNQHRLSGAYNQLIAQNEKILFHFMTIRENITEAMVNNDWRGVDDIVRDLESLNAELSILKDNQLISAELKLAMAEKVDIKGVAIILRRMQPSAPILQEKLRAIADYLIQYDRVIVGQARGRIVNFQLVVIGALGLLVTLASFSLILLSKNTVSPLLQLAGQLKDTDALPDKIRVHGPVVNEVVGLVESLNRLIELGRLSSHEHPAYDQRQLSQLAELINENTNRLNGIINYAQLLDDSTEKVHFTDEQRRMVDEIITEASRLAEQWQRLAVHHPNRPVI